MPSAADAARLMLTVCLIRGPQGLTDARLGLLVQVADLRTQAFDHGFKLGTSPKKFQALGNQRGHRFRPSFLHLVSGPVVKFLAERDADLLGHTGNHTRVRTGSGGEMLVRSKYDAACGSGSETALALGAGFGWRGFLSPAPPPRPR